MRLKKKIQCQAKFFFNSSDKALTIMKPEKQMKKLANGYVAHSGRFARKPRRSKPIPNSKPLKHQSATIRDLSDSRVRQVAVGMTKNIKAKITYAVLKLKI